MPLILTHADEHTGQPLYDYFITRITDAQGYYLEIDEYGLQRRYSVVMTITKRHVIA
jgi:hypothetical protein